MPFETDQATACNETGFVPEHAAACEEVSQRVNTIILFREPGPLARGLIEENYGMKGFRIDTKSCNWGPMAGFVCVDPRFTKDPKYHEKNEEWTAEALYPFGYINHKYFGDKVTDKDWVADVMPIVISQTRFDELKAKGIINPIPVGAGDYTTLVHSTEFKDGRYPTTLWIRLMSTGHHRRFGLDWLQGAHQHYVLCIDNDKGFIQFQQRYPPGVEPIMFMGRETVLGMINPGTKGRGFKASVTADYDLFAIGPYKNDDTVAKKHMLMGQIQKKYVPQGPRGDQRYFSGFTNQKWFLPGNVPRLGDIDTRLSQSELTDFGVKVFRRMVKVKEFELQDEKMPQKVYSLHEHHRFGDVNARVMLIKTLLNSALLGKTRESGNAVHHNDEAGNFAVAKGTLQDCLPLIGFTPIQGYKTVLIRYLQDFKEFVNMVEGAGYEMKVKPAWRNEASL
jgi:hypothetical protein